MLNKLLPFLIGFLLVYISPAAAEILLLTFHYNKPDFIELQYKTFKKFMVDDYQLIVFNDAKTAENEQAIRKMCENYNIPCIRYEQQWHLTDPLNDKVFQWLNNPQIYSHLTFSMGIADQPSIRHCHVIQYALDMFGYTHNDIVALVDGDIFPIRPLELRSLLADCHIAGIQKFFSTENIDYLWVPFIAFDMRKLPDRHDLKFHADVIHNKLYDTGAHSFYYLRDHPDLYVKKYGGHSSTCFYNLSNELMMQHGFNEREIELTKNLPWPLCLEFHLEHRLLHFGASSFDVEGHEDKSKHLTAFLEEILKDQP